MTSIASRTMWPGLPDGETATSGKADAFLDFIQSELMPMIEGEFGGDPGDATIVGHSSGGLLASYALVSRPGRGRDGMRKPSASKTITRDPAALGVVVSPGEMLLEEFIRPLGLKQPALAAEVGVSLNRLNEIVLGKRGITADTAIRLARRFNMSPQFWMRLQADWELAQALGREGRQVA